MNFLRRLALQGEKIDDSSRLDVVEIARVTCFQACFLPGRAEDLSGSRHIVLIYPLVSVSLCVCFYVIFSGRTSN